jgi:hypothetical protein
MKEINFPVIKRIKFPIEVNKIIFPKKFIDKYYGGDTGDWVAVRPCNEKYKDKTFLGILLGELPVTCGCSYDKEKALEFYLHMNPAIYVPEIKEIIFGCGSWWHKLDNPEDLKQITKKDINDVWYVKALKELAKEKRKNKMTNDILSHPKGWSI